MQGTYLNFILLPKTTINLDFYQFACSPVWNYNVDTSKFACNLALTPYGQWRAI